MKQHRGELPGGAKYLRNKGPFLTRQLWQTHDRSRATQFEMWVKSLSKKNKLRLIASPGQTEFDDVFACERLDRQALLRE